jgi:hypothetical protein
LLNGNVPAWDDAAGQLRWREVVLLVLANHAHAERAVLKELQRLDWRWVIVSPMDAATIGDPTQECRHAIHYLNTHQAQADPVMQLHFFCLHGGFIGWCPRIWLLEEQTDDRSSSQP